jgi:uncharacterized protein
VGEESGTADKRTDAAPCVGCGLCCDGTIFERERTSADEVDRLRSEGLTVVEEGNNYYFQHPCRFADHGRCTIYETRFAVCRTFRCKVLKAYQKGEIELEEAKHRVNKALALKAEVTKEEPTAGVWQQRQEFRKSMQLSKERPQLHLKMAALDFLLDRWFRK